MRWSTLAFVLGACAPVEVHGALSPRGIPLVLRDGVFATVLRDPARELSRGRLVVDLGSTGRGCEDWVGSRSAEQPDRWSGMADGTWSLRFEAAFVGRDVPPQAAGTFDPIVPVADEDAGFVQVERWEGGAVVETHTPFGAYTHRLDGDRLDLRLDAIGGWGSGEGIDGPVVLDLQVSANLERCAAFEALEPEG